MVFIKKFKSILKKVRSPIISIFLPVIFEVLHNFGGDWTTNRGFNYSLPNIFAAIIAIFYIILITYWGYKDYNDSMNIDVLKEQLDNNKITFNGIHNLIKYSSADIIKKIDEISNKNDYSKGSLDIFDASTSICQQVHITLSEIFNKNKDNITVNMYLKVPKGKSYCCRMIAHEGTISHPKIYLQDLSLDNKNSNQKYLCQKIFIENNPEYRILSTPNEINDQFKLNKDNNGKYSQYIGIPLTDNNNTIIALLEINVLNKTMIFNNIDEGIALIRKYLQPFISMFMLSLNLNNLLDVMDKEYKTIKGENSNG